MTDNDYATTVYLEGNAHVAQGWCARLGGRFEARLFGPYAERWEAEAEAKRRTGEPELHPEKFDPDDASGVENLDIDRTR
jgi:hypothetical protein